MKTINHFDAETAADIMTRAHAMTRATLAKEPGLDYRATFAAALSVAHAEHGMTAAEIWNSYTGEEQYTYLLRMAGYEYRIDGARTNAKTGQPLICFQWLTESRLDIAEELRGIAHSAWIAVTEYLERNPETETALGRIVSREICKAAVKVNRAEHRNARAIRNTTDPETGEERSVIDTKAGAEAARIESPETAACVTDLIDRACKDAADRLVIADRIAGYTQTETAAILNIGQRAVAKRLDGIRDRLAETIGRDPRAKKAPRGKHARKA